jgi:hypothetical protein
MVLKSVLVTKLGSQLTLNFGQALLDLFHFVLGDALLVEDCVVFVLENIDRVFFASN